MSEAWFSLACEDCENASDDITPRPCVYHGQYGAGYEAGFEAAMRSLVQAVRPSYGWSGNPAPYVEIHTPDGKQALGDKGWGEGPPLRFKEEAEAQAAIATAPRWWPNQPWEDEG